MNLTQLLIVLVIIGLLAYDAFAPKLGQPTESQVLRGWAIKWNVLPFCAGILLGHWFFWSDHPWSKGWMYALPSILIVLAYDIFLNLKGMTDKHWLRYPGLWALIGVPVGALLWGQSL